MKRRILYLLIAGTPVLATAHPGHGTFDGFNLMHYVTSPMHVGLFALTAGVIYLLSKYIKAQKG